MTIVLPAAAGSILAGKTAGALVGPVLSEGVLGNPMCWTTELFHTYGGQRRATPGNTTFSQLRILNKLHIMKLGVRMACVRHERSREYVEAARMMPHKRRTMRKVSA